MSVEGLERTTLGTTYVFVSNHQSIYDTPVLFASLPYQLRIIAKASLAQFPVLGWHLKRGRHLFVDRAAMLARELATLSARLPADGVLWVSWPKKASGVATDIREDHVRALALPLGLVDVKVCAIDATWSGLKLVWRRELRAGKPARS